MAHCHRTSWRLIFLTAWVLGLGLSLTHAWADQASSPCVLVEAGQARAVIVTPAKPLPVVQYAAKELQHHLRRATNVTLAIVPEGTPLPEGFHGLYLGDTASARQAGIQPDTLAGNDFVIQRAGGDLLLVGGDSDGQPLGGYVNRTRVGTLFAVYELLETQLGVRWLWPGELGEFVPPADRVAIHDFQTRSTYPYVWAHWRVSPRAGQGGWHDQAKRERFIHEQDVFLRRHRFSQLQDLRATHSFEKYWDRFGQDHPEYFAQQPDGRRGPLVDDTRGIRVSMCVSQPGLWRQIVADWQARKGHQRDVGFIAIGENDTPGMCLCPDCRAWDAPQRGFETGTYWTGQATTPLQLTDRFGATSWALGFRGADAPSLADRYARFYLAVQRQAEQAGGIPVRVGGFAYANYAPPPTQTRLNERVVISLVPGMGEGFYFPFTQAKRQRFREQWQGWRDAGASLMLRPNYTLSGHNFPIFYAREIAEDFQFAAKHGLIATDFDSLVGSWAAQGPTLYTLARVHTRRDWPAQRYLDEYYAAFGPAEQAVRAYFDHWEAVSSAVTDERMADIQAKLNPPVTSSYRYWYAIAPHIFTPEVMRQGRSLLDAALQAAGHDDLARRRVAYLELGLRHADLTLAVQQAYLAYHATPTTPTLDGYRQALRDLERFRAKHEGDAINHMGYLVVNEGRLWDRSLAKLDELGELLPADWRIAWDADRQGQTNRWFAPDLDDSDTTRWQPIGVEAHWHKQPAGQAYQAAHGKAYEGIAWYRNRFNVNPAHQGQRVMLVFGAVDAACTVYLNGQVVAERPFPFEGNTNSWAEPFEVDITRHVHWDQANTLAVRVDPISGQGGLWKPVRLITRQTMADAQANHIVNPSFEPAPPGRQAAKAGRGWRYLPAQGQSDFAIDDSQALFGRHAARVTLVDQASGRLVQHVTGLTAGRPYRLRLHARTSPAFTGRLTANVQGVKAVQANTNGLWRELTLEVTPQEDRAYVALWLHQATGDVWIDGVELVALP